MRVAVFGLFLGLGLAALAGWAVTAPSDWGPRIAFAVILPLLGLVLAVHIPARGSRE